MRGPSGAAALGVLLLLLGFATGTWQTSTSEDGVQVSCAPPIDVTRLPFNGIGADSSRTPAKTSTSEAHRSETACRSATLPLRLVTWTALAVGGLVGLAGWTAARERRTASRGATGVSRPGAR